MSYSYNKIKELKPGAVFYTVGKDKNLKYTLKDKPTQSFCSHLEREQLIFWGINESGNEKRFLITQTMEHYGPRLYSHPPYIFPEDIKKFNLNKDKQ